MKKLEGFREKGLEIGEINVNWNAVLEGKWAEVSTKWVVKGTGIRWR